MLCGRFFLSLFSSLLLPLCTTFTYSYTFTSSRCVLSFSTQYVISYRNHSIVGLTYIFGIGHAMSTTILVGSFRSLVWFIFSAVRGAAFLSGKSINIRKRHKYVFDSTRLEIGQLFWPRGGGRNSDNRTFVRLMQDCLGVSNYALEFTWISISSRVSSTYQFGWITHCTPQYEEFVKSQTPFGTWTNHFSHIHLQCVLILSFVNKYFSVRGAHCAAPYDFDAICSDQIGTEWMNGLLLALLGIYLLLMLLPVAFLSHRNAGMCP